MAKRFIDFVQHEVKEFRVLGFDGTSKVDITFTLDDEFNEENPYEWINAFIQFEYFEEINKLEVGKNLFVKLARDEDNVKGVIVRTK